MAFGFAYGSAAGIQKGYMKLKILIIGGPNIEGG